MSTADVVAEPVNGEDVRIDLVFVHGLSDNWQDTWKKDGLSWIQDFIPKDIPHARIFTCGFNTQHGSKKDTSLSMRGLEDYERKRGHEKRPVIFLAHSLGGLILQAFLQNCDLPLRTSTKGIMFFSTPNTIQQKDQRTRFAFAMARIHYTFEDEYLSHLGSISGGFSKWLLDGPFAGRVVFFYERLPIVDDLMIVEEEVEKESAVLPRSETRGLHASHMNMTKFSSASDANYQIILQCLKSMYCLADEGMRVLLRHSLKESPHGRLSNLPTTPDGCEEVIVSTQGTTADRDIVRLALVAEDQGHYNKAEGKYQVAVNSLSSRGHCSPAVRELGHLAVAHAERDLDVEIEKKFERVSRLLQSNESPGRDDAAILFCIHKWAYLMYGRGCYRHAELYSRYCSEARIKLYGKGSTSTLLTTANWISSMMSLGKYQEARNTIQDALENQDLTFPNDVSAVHLLETFAKLASKCGCHDLAESLLCDVLRKAIYLHGYEHPFTLNSMSELAAILAQKGNLSSAEALSRRSLDGLEQTLGNDHPDCLRVARRLADYICFQQRYDDAILRHKQILTKQRLRIGNQHPETLLTMRSLGIDFALHRYWKDAEMSLDLAFSGLKACLGPNDENTVWAESALKSVKESQERALEEGVMQTDLLEMFRPQPNPTSDLKYTYGPSPFQTSVEGELLRAVIDRDEENLRSILVNQTTNPHILGRALREAAASSHESIVKLLLEFDAPVNAQSGYHGSALQAASLAGSGAIVELLLGHKADMKQEGGILGNALRAAVFGRHEAILSLLLGSVPPCGPLQNVLNTSIQLALRTENMAMIDNLMKAGADINAEDKLFGSPLQQASFYGQEKVMMMLLERKSDINMRGGLFGSPLRAAIETQNESAINQLLGAGAMIHANSAERLPDGHISIDERAELAKILLNRLADSLPYRSLSGVSGSYDPMQISKQSVMNTMGWTGPETHLGTHHDSESPSSDAKPARVSTMKRILFELKSGGNTDGSIKTQSMRKGLKQKSRRTLSQVFRRKFSMQV